MKKVFVIIFLSIQLVVFAQDIPSSSRSREAIERVKPNLQIEFKESGFSPGLPILFENIQLLSLILKKYKVLPENTSKIKNI